MGLIRNFRIRRAAKSYAAELRPMLVMILGERKFYTTCQIKSVAEDLGLNMNYLVLGYACFLPQNRFATEKEAEEHARKYFAYNLTNFGIRYLGTEFFPEY